jgi:hypothetical protein
MVNAFLTLTPSDSISLENIKISIKGYYSKNKIKMEKKLQRGKTSLYEEYVAYLTTEVAEKS